MTITELETTIMDMLGMKGMYVKSLMLTLRVGEVPHIRAEIISIVDEGEVIDEKQFEYANGLLTEINT